MKITIAKVRQWTTTLSLLLALQESLSAAPDIVAPKNMSGLSIRKEGTNIVLTWPSAPPERFVVLWHLEVSVESRWIELTNQLCASPLTNQTIFRDPGAFVRGPAMLTNADLADFYRVFSYYSKGQITWFDEVGRRTYEQDQGGKVTAFGYDTLGRMTAVKAELHTVECAFLWAMPRFVRKS